jgi:hypothetical protein
MIDTKNTHFRKDNPRNIPAKFVFKEFCGLNFFLKIKNKIVRALIRVLAIIFLSGMAIEKRVEVNIIVSKYIFPYLVLRSRQVMHQLN